MRLWQCLAMCAGSWMGCLSTMKSALLEKIRVVLRARVDRLAKAAYDAHAAATDPGSKAEGKYDTRDPQNT